MIIDVRDTHEWDAGHIDGAVHRPLGNLPQSLATLDRSTPVAVHCAGGTRSAIGAGAAARSDWIQQRDGPDGWVERVG